MKIFKGIKHVTPDEEPVFADYDKDKLDWYYNKSSCLFPTEEGFVLTTWFKPFYGAEKEDDLALFVTSTEVYEYAIDAVRAVKQTVYCDNDMLRKMIEEEDEVILIDKIKDENERRVMDYTKMDKVKRFKNMTIYIREGVNFPINDKVAYEYLFLNKECTLDVLFDGIQ